MGEVGPGFHFILVLSFIISVLWMSNEEASELLHDAVDKT